MRLSLTLICLLLLGSAARAQPAGAGGPRPDPDDSSGRRARESDSRDGRVAAAVGAGGGLAFASLAVGGGMAGAWLDDTDKRKYGLEVMAAGVGLAPIVTFAILRDWRRALGYGAVTVALGAAAIGLIEGTDAQQNYGDTAPRLLLAFTVAVETGVTTFALFDALQAGERARRWALLPSLTPRWAGLTFGGRF